MGSPGISSEMQMMEPTSTYESEKPSHLFLKSPRVVLGYPHPATTTTAAPATAASATPCHRQHHPIPTPPQDKSRGTCPEAAPALHTRLPSPAPPHLAPDCSCWWRGCMVPDPWQSHYCPNLILVTNLISWKYLLFSCLDLLSPQGKLLLPTCRV